MFRTVTAGQSVGWTGFQGKPLWKRHESRKQDLAAPARSLRSWHKRLVALSECVSSTASIQKPELHHIESTDITLSEANHSENTEVRGCEGEEFKRARIKFVHEQNVRCRN